MTNLPSNILHFADGVSLMLVAEREKRVDERVVIVPKDRIFESILKVHVASGHTKSRTLHAAVSVPSAQCL